MTTPAAEPRATELVALLGRIAQLLTAAEPHSEAPESTAADRPSRVLLKVEEAAQALGIGKTKAASLVSSGQLESVKIGRLRRVHVESVARYAARLVVEQSTDHVG